MRHLFSFFLFFCCLRAIANAQITRNSVLVESLFSDSMAIANISYEGYPYINITEQPFNELPQELLKNKNGLYIFLNGSGRLYKAVEDKKGISFQRIDTTRYFGYNGGSFAFCYNDTIYNLGGYGIWRTNGQLRMYIEKTKQWDIVKLNIELPTMYSKQNTLLWYDQYGKKIYTGISYVRDQAIKSNKLNETEFVYEVSILDLVTKDWKKIGKLSVWLKEKISIISNITSSPWGQLVLSGNKFMLIDFKRNRLLSLRPAKEEEIVNTLAPHVGDNAFYFKDSVLFVANSQINRIDSFLLSDLDFIPTNEIVYEPLASPTIKKGLSYYWFVLLGVVLFGMGLWFIVLRNQRKPHFMKDEMVPEENQNGNGIHHIVFEERELEILKLIYDNSSSAKSTTIEELNKTLGISKRNNEIQKKQRSDVITSINKKYHYMHPETDIVLDKKRSENDKRSFEYFIKFELLDDVNGLLEKANSKKAE